MAANQPTLFDTETWKPVPNYEGLYEVSNFGNVRSLDREIVGSDGVPQRFKGQTMAQCSNGSHFNVKLRSGHQRREVLYVHRLVLAAFVGPCPEGMEVRHLDGNPANNRLENLKYGTVSENRFDSVRHGTHVETRKTHCPKGHILAEPNLVRCAKKNGHRNCLACSRANVYVRRHELTEEQKVKVYEMYYKKIMEER